jgi:plasmid stabilization system protein ParE
VSRYAFTPAAAADLAEIWAYVADDSLAVADRVIDDLFTAVERVADHPEIGRARDDLADETLRTWPVHSYLIVYRPQQRPIEIVRVVSGYRDLLQLFHDG